ncbi:recombinase family protein [Agromyces bauzanensis]
MTAVIYARISDDPTGREAGVDRQQDECRELAERKGVAIAHTLVDNDISATNGKRRPAFERLLGMIERGEIDTVVVWHTDRLYRLPRDLEPIITLAEGRRLRFLTVTASEIDLNTPSGRMVARMLAAASAQEVEHKAERQRSANVQRAKRGYWQFSNRPFGYQRVDGVIEVVPEEADALREAYDRFIAGDTYYAISEDLNARGIRTATGSEWTMTQLRDRMLNPHYAGIATYKGDETGTGDWEPIISMDTWERFKAARTRRKVRHAWSNKTKYLLSGLALCGECGGRLLARPEYRRQRNGDGSKIVVMTYQCTTNWCVSRKLEPIDAMVAEAVVDRLSQPDALELLTPAVDVAPLVHESQELRARRDDLAALLADGYLTAAAVREQSDNLTRQLEALQEQISRAEGGSNLSGLIMADDIAHHWHNVMTFAQKRAILTAGLTVTIHKQASTRRFDPDSVRIQWKG